MRLQYSPSLALARTMLAWVWGIVWALTLAAPMLASFSCLKVASFLYISYSQICHQIPERSFSLWGHPFAVCHRCSGMYFGLFLGSLFGDCRAYRSPGTRRFLILVAAAPLLLDVLLPCTGLWVNTGSSRFFTGLLLGTLISPLLVLGWAEFLNELHAGGTFLPASLSRGEFHE